MRSLMKRRNPRRWRRLPRFTREARDMIGSHANVRADDRLLIVDSPIDSCVLYGKPPMLFSVRMSWLCNAEARKTLRVPEYIDRNLWNPRLPRLLSKKLRHPRTIAKENKRMTGTHDRPAVLHSTSSKFQNHPKPPRPFSESVLLSRLSVEIDRKDCTILSHAPGSLPFSTTWSYRFHGALCLNRAPPSWLPATGAPRRSAP
jgi:hypothetical protein